MEFLTRMGLLAVLRSRSQGGVSIGAMITASHNPAPDNGVKLVDPAGEMLEQEWEAAATTLANCKDADLPNQLDQIVVKYSIPSTGGKVIVGRDTRLSSPALSQACVRGVEAVGGSVVDLGVVTTPQLHYMVVATNTEGAYGEPTIQGYYAKISGAFKKFISLTGEKKVYKAKLMFDGANGVGAPAMVEFNKLLSDVLEVEMVNQGEGELNSGCGADYVKVVNPSMVPYSPQS